MDLSVFNDYVDLVDTTALSVSGMGLAGASKENAVDGIDGT